MKFSYIGEHYDVDFTNYEIVHDLIDICEKEDSNIYNYTISIRHPHLNNYDGLVSGSLYDGEWRTAVSNIGSFNFDSVEDILKQKVEITGFTIREDVNSNYKVNLFTKIVQDMEEE
jgi:hypothetical protein